MFPCGEKGRLSILYPAARFPPFCPVLPRFPMWTCPICLCGPKETKSAMRQLMLPCSHEYCRTCIKTWFHRSLSCPICRTEFSNKKMKRFKIPLERTLWPFTCWLYSCIGNYCARCPYFSGSTLTAFLSDYYEAKNWSVLLVWSGISRHSYVCIFMAVLSTVCLSGRLHHGIVTTNWFRLVCLWFQTVCLSRNYSGTITPHLINWEK